MKVFVKMVCFVVVCILFATVVGAHSGRTDSSGGHYNRSTGEYHYHHGQGPHDHWDIDGDGIKDCPYEYYGAIVKKILTILLVIGVVIAIVVYVIKRLKNK